jgi:hypothetical protein
MCVCSWCSSHHLDNLSSQEVDGDFSKRIDDSGWMKHLRLLLVGSVMAAEKLLLEVRSFRCSSNAELIRRRVPRF